MPKLIERLPHARVEPVTEVLHGVTITDPYRWLEDGSAPDTHAWLAEQNQYTKAYFEEIDGRADIRQRVRQLLDVEAYDSIQKAGPRYVFRKRLVGCEQPSIYLREGLDGEDQVLLNPADRGTGKYTAFRPLQLSPNGRLLLYEVQQGGEKSGVFELFDIDKRSTLSDALPYGYLGGFAFGPDASGFYYAHEPRDSERQFYRSVQYHTLGTGFDTDTEVFSAGEDRNLHLRIIPGEEEVGFLVYRVAEAIYTNFYLFNIAGNAIERLIENATYRFEPLLCKGHLLALTDWNAPHFRIVEVSRNEGSSPTFRDVVRATDAPIRSWVASTNRIYVSYVKETKTRIDMFDLSGQALGTIPIEQHNTVRLVGAAADADELFFERESFTKPIAMFCYESLAGVLRLWAERRIAVNSTLYGEKQVSYKAQDGTSVPMFLVGRSEILEGGCHPTIMTAYGGYGVPMTPQFSVFVMFLLECGCLFAVPSIRGGSEFGAEWHNAAKRQNRQVAFNDFIAAAEWLISTGRSESNSFGIFGGSNSGLLVAAALTQHPDLFRAVVCMAPLLDMLRYHLFDSAHLWKEEFGTSDDPRDFAALASYSPYHRVRDGIGYPAILMVSGDADQSCNPLHARKMIARLQAASASKYPILLDYSKYRGHVPVLPLSHRIDALTNRLAFLCDQLQLPRNARGSARVAIS